MATLLLRLAGPMQSWGTTSRFDQRDTGKEPSKSGVIGLVAAALGLDRETWTELEPLTQLTMGVRHDRPGVLKYDYQTAGHGIDDQGKGRIIRANGRDRTDEGVVSKRFYLADAAFLVGLSGTDRPLLERINAALKDPVWPPALGRKSYVPSEPLWLEDAIGEGGLKETLSARPWIGRLRTFEDYPERLLLSLESEDGSGVLKMDQPLSSFAERRFGSRFVRSEWIAFPQEVSLVSD